MVSTEVLWIGTLGFKIPKNTKLLVHEERGFSGLIARIAVGTNAFLLYIHGEQAGLRKWVQPNITVRGYGLILSQTSQHGGSYVSALLLPSDEAPEFQLRYYNGQFDYKARAHAVFEQKIPNSEGGIQICRKI